MNSASQPGVLEQINCSYYLSWIEDLPGPIMHFRDLDQVQHTDQSKNHNLESALAWTDYWQL